MTSNPRKIAFLVVAALLVIFILQNFGAADVDFLFWSLSLPAGLIYILIFGAGYAFAKLPHLWRP